MTRPYLRCVLRQDEIGNTRAQYRIVMGEQQQDLVELTFASPEEARLNHPALERLAERVLQLEKQARRVSAETLDLYDMARKMGEAISHMLLADPQDSDLLRMQDQAQQIIAAIRAFLLGGADQTTALSRASAEMTQLHEDVMRWIGQIRRPESHLRVISQTNTEEAND